MDIAPRVNFELLQRYIERRVRLVGQLENLQGNVLKLKTSDNGTVNVLIKPGAGFDSPFIEVEGIVESPNTIRELDHTNFGSSFDMSLYNEVCRLSNNEFQALFS
ncbi:hypothetical protein WJX74_005199 [Apatococcus lobatus]|uniref:Replication factor A protein 3 n=1 Tax=Apatococcus lobatus TaxID=904363 RepID=A0AAW1SG87_9CHLO